MTKNACNLKQSNKHRGVSQSNPTSTKKEPEIHRQQFEHHNAQTTKKRAHFQNRKQIIRVDHSISLLEKDLAITQSDQISTEKIKPLKIQPFRQPYNNPFDNLKQKQGLFGNKSNSGKSISLQSKISPRTSIKNLQRTPIREWASSRQGIRKSRKNVIGMSSKRRYVMGSVNSLQEFNRELVYKGFRRQMPSIYEKNQYFDIDEISSSLEEDYSDEEDGEEEEYSSSPQRDQSYSFNPFVIERGRNRLNNQEQDVVRYFVGEEELIYARILDYPFALLPPQPIQYYPQHAGFQRPLTDSNNFLPLDLSYIQQQQFLASQTLLPHKFYENAFLYAHYGIHQASLQQENMQRNQFESQKLFQNAQDQKQSLDPESSPQQQSKICQSEQENQIISSVSNYKQQRFETTEMGTKQSHKDSFCPPSMNEESPFRPSVDLFNRNFQWNQTTTQKQTNYNRQFNNMSQETTTININSSERFNSIRPLNVGSEDLDKRKQLFQSGKGAEQTSCNEPIEISSTPQKVNKKNRINKKQKRNSAKNKEYIQSQQPLGTLSKFSSQKENIIEENNGPEQEIQEESEKKTAFKTEIVERSGSGSFNPFITAPPSKDEIVYVEDSEMTEEPEGLATYPDHCTCQRNECSKGYCKCFYQNRGCDPLKCKCKNCKNTNTDIDTVEKRKQLQQIKENISAGCSCQKNKCKKKYCVCKLKGLKCGVKCRCVDCTNRGPNDPPCGDH